MSIRADKCYIRRLLFGNLDDLTDDSFIRINVNHSNQQWEIIHSSFNRRLRWRILVTAEADFFVSLCKTPQKIYKIYNFTLARMLNGVFTLRRLLLKVVYYSIYYFLRMIM